ncbi:hypothetical protein AB0J90_10870 [Micromonospora sp. NPDC049523]|uniref:hypothetical protein n=1 Tax=Micromonospora sp. NPDC049523 TaxID=3155921 RepID=UPI00344133E0
MLPEVATALGRGQRPRVRVLVAGPVTLAERDQRLGHVRRRERPVVPALLGDPECLVGEFPATGPLATRPAHGRPAGEHLRPVHDRRSIVRFGAVQDGSGEERLGVVELAPAVQQHTDPPGERGGKRHGHRYGGEVAQCFVGPSAAYRRFGQRQIGVRCPSSTGGHRNSVVSARRPPGTVPSRVATPPRERPGWEV